MVSVKKKVPCLCQQQLTDSTIRVTAGTVSPNRSSPFRQTGNSLRVPVSFLFSATGSRTLSHTPAQRQKVQFTYKHFSLGSQTLNEIVNQTKSILGLQHKVWMENITILQLCHSSCNKKKLLSISAYRKLCFWDSAFGPNHDQNHQLKLVIFS